ncbi:MAG: DEAD/DEAH box helicase family protein [Synergistaceae bacterium]|jgi:type III restriction enzyme|nr:DEAD/DEAH box helicase family protein [Synergistaceae bacterium]
MKFNFKIQPFQTEAVDSVINVFNGQSRQERVSYRRDGGKWDEPQNKRTPLFASGHEQDGEEKNTGDAGYKNATVALSEKQLLDNIRATQTRNNIKLSPSLVRELGAVSLDVEMETGTGKTYVYIKTMFELHKRYGWSKFIVVVPSIAIREGVKKSFEMTLEHFMEHYGKKARFFVYNSSNLHKLDEFSSGFGINVMIINIQAFATSLKEDGRGKEARVIYSGRDEFGSRRPIDVIKANRPIVILDEPQKMGGAATQNALKNNFNPLFSLNYSATHRTQHNLVYVLDALDAFQKHLVKKIQVKGFEIKNLRGTDKYLYLAEIVLDHRKPPRARLEFEVKQKNGIKRKTHLFSAGDSLYAESNELEQYKGLSVAEVDPFRGLVTFNNGDILSAGSGSCGVSENDVRRIQIRETITSHFEKEEMLFQSGIKCLSLFFIDEVARYRRYGEDGAESLGEYGRIFEEEYLAALNERLSLFDSPYQEYLIGIEAIDTHKGYFSIDKRGHPVNSALKRGSEFSDDISAYDLILKNKERLLSFDEPTRFIFSHSALREGWDNPNVFQICTLKHSGNATAKRQEVGRGLRLCLNQFGDRQDIDVWGEQVHNLNLLTVIASESYAGFVSGLQSEIREDLYERPAKAAAEYFTRKSVMFGGELHLLNKHEAKVIYNYLLKNGYIDLDGNVTPEYRYAAERGVFADLPADLAPMSAGIHALVQSIFDQGALDAMIDDGHGTKVKANPLNDNFHKKEFQELWSAINHRYAYTVEFDSGELARKSIAAIYENLYVTKLQYTLTEGLQTGAEFDVSRAKTRTLEHSQDSSVRYDLVGKIAKGTTLTRRTVTAILEGLGHEKLSMFCQNPEEFIFKVTLEINRQKAAVVVEHISYRPSAEEPYKQDIFNMSKSPREFAKAFQAKKAVQDYVFTDDTAENSVERRFAEDLDNAGEVVVYAKLPSGPKGFHIPTPVGHYSPGWAIAFRRGTVKHIFFIAETKGAMDSLNLKPIEQAKISCAKKLFNELSTSKVKYHEADSYQSLLDIMQKL